MVGRTLLHNKVALILLTLIMVVFTSCGVVCAAAKGPVAILLSSNEEIYKQQADIFAMEVGQPTQIFNLYGDIQHDPELKEKIFAISPSLIHALGAKAAYAAKLWTKERKDIPVVFSMVLNWQRYNLLEDSENMAGVAAELSPGTQFANMTIFSPSLKRIGLLFSPQTEALVTRARKEAAKLGLELIAEPIVNSKDFRNGFKRISGQIDAFWVLNDPVAYTLENLEWLEERCIKEKLFCVGQNQNLARIGLTLTVNPDVPQIATQAAAMSKNILLRGQKTTDIKVMEPLGTQLFLNIKTAERIGLAITEQAKNMASTVLP